MIESYDLDIDVDFTNAIIRGSVTIHAIDIKDSIELDAKELTISDVKVNGAKSSFDYDPTKEIIRISHLSESRESLITIDYEKKISDKATSGVYKSRYGDEYFIATDFEPDRARTFFPCKDNPAWKAIFNLRVVTDSDLKVISNSAINRVEETADANRKRFVFDPTPKMSTYLFFVGVGRFSEATRAASSKSEPTVLLASRPGTSDKSDFILETASKALRETGRYFDAPYPLKKLHLIALPEYPGAMENWGAITSFEAGLLIDKMASAFDRRRAAIVTTHEIQHQWFGDLVTMKWWDDIWLNESFATFMSFKIVDRLYPQWNVWSDFLSRSEFESMKIDQLAATHPIKAKITRPAEINEVFDHISYGKGASVLRMVEAFLGEETFRRGVSDYIKRFSYSNATSEDLWRALEDASSEPVTRVMSAWITKSGFPLVSVSRSGEKLVFRQKRFVLTGGEAADMQPWPIPMVMDVNGKPAKLLLDRSTQEVAIEGGGLAELKVNSGQTGYYCVKYDEGLYETLANNFTSMSGLDKAGVLNDLFQLLKAGEVDPQIYFRFVRLCGEVEDYTTALTVHRQIRILNSIAEGSKAVGDSSRAFLQSQMDRLTVHRKEKESENDGILRGEVAYLLARLDADFAGGLAKEFDEFSSVDPNLKAAVATAYARTVGEGALDRMLEMVTESQNEAEREKLYIALTSSDDPSIVGKTIELSASGRVSRSDIDTALYNASFNPRARQVTWAWIKGNYDRLWELLGSTLRVMFTLQDSVPLVAVEDEAGAASFFSGERLLKGETVHRQNLELLSVYARLRSRLS